MALTPEQMIQLVADLKATNDTLLKQVEAHAKNWQALAAILQPPASSLSDGSSPAS